MSNEFSFCVLAEDLSSLTNKAALQEALHKLDFDQLSELSTLLLFLKPEYENELNKFKNQKFKTVKTNGNVSFFKIIVELNNTIKWCEAMADCGLLFEQIDNITINLKEFEMFIQNINLDTFDTSANSINNYLKLLHSFELNFNSLPLLCAFYKGYFYNRIKNIKQITNEKLAEQLFLDVNKIQRLIRLFTLIHKYPLLLKTKISPSDLGNYAAKIDNYISNNTEICNKFKLKILNIKILFKETNESGENIAYNLPLLY